MDTNRQCWNQGHQRLRRALAGNDPQAALDLFLSLHAMVHSQKMSGANLWSFEDEVLHGVSEAQIRCIPPGGEHSIAWILFHIARIEDITINLLVAGTTQLFVRDGWKQKLRVNIPHSANRMDDRSIAALSAEIDIASLRAYRRSVGRRTRQIVRTLKPEQFQEKAKETRLQKVMDQGALLPEAIGILHYWSKRTIAGLLLMPPTRHNFLHLNEALRTRLRLQR